VRGRPRGRGMRVTGHARGYVIWPVHKVIEHMSSNPRGLRALGKVLKPNAHALAERLLHAAADPPRPMPPSLISEVVLLLLALPGPKRGRPPEATTLRALQLYAELQTKHGAARAMSRETGEDFETVRRRLRSKPRKPKRKGGT
jgi:hypothetical protein